MVSRRGVGVSTCLAGGNGTNVWSAPATIICEWRRRNLAKLGTGFRAVHGRIPAKRTIVPTVPTRVPDVGLFTKKSRRARVCKCMRIYRVIVRIPGRELRVSRVRRISG